MNGEFRGDFTRDTFEPQEHFLRVLSQQGRVWLEADWNEHTSIILHYLQALATDIIGDQGGWGDGFKIEEKIAAGSAECDDFLIYAGHYYVNGILCENEERVCYSKQKDYPLVEEEKLDELIKRNPSTLGFLVYLDVWERHINYIQDRNRYMSIREVALGERDTATRSKVVWQVKVRSLPVDFPSTPSFCENIKNKWREVNASFLQPENRGLLRAEAKSAEGPKYPCTISPEAKFSGDRNGLYRVEIHRAGKDLAASGGKSEEAATFKWSGENGSVDFALSIPVSGYTVENDREKAIVTLENLRCSDYHCLSEKDWVEVVDDDYILQNRAEPLWQVASIDILKGEVMLERAKWKSSSVGSDMAKNPLLRRWDQKDGAINKGSELQAGIFSEGGVVIVESDVGDTNEIWQPLENGIKIQFQKSEPGMEHEYRTGDYWLIPARTATGDIEWPKETQPNMPEMPKALKPHGIDHHYAPLATISLDANRNAILSPNSDCRCKFKRLCE